MAKKDRSGDDSGQGRGRDDNHTETHAAESSSGAARPSDDPPGHDQGDDDHGGAGLRGTAGADSLLGTAADERVRGGAGADTLDGGAGADTLEGGQGADQLTGGAGTDAFKVDGSAKTLAGLDRITDFTHGEDKLVFDDHALAATPDTFATATAADYGAALAAANAKMAAGADYVAVQIGTDVIVFATEAGEHHVESAVVLVGRTLTDIGAGDIG